LKTLFTIRLLTSVLGVSTGAVLVLQERQTQQPLTNREKTKISKKQNKKRETTNSF
jgi:hypothetical protein